MDADGTGVVRVTTDPDDDFDPTWSPDGERIAFTSFRDFLGDIYVIGVDGAGEVNITNNPARKAQPAWSPNGTRIAFVRTTFELNHEIAVMDAGGGGLVQLTNAPDDDVEPAWSPDGTRVVFSAGAPLSRNIHVMNADGSGRTQLTTSPADDGRTDWQPVQLADLTVTISDGPDPIAVGRELTYTVTVSNAGPSTATGTVLQLSLDPAVAFASAGGACGYDSTGHVVVCELGQLTPESSTTVQAVVRTIAGERIAGVATVVAAQADPTPGDSTATSTTTVNGPVATPPGCGSRPPTSPSAPVCP